jgi:hypothetical protein
LADIRWVRGVSSSLTPSRDLRITARSVVRAENRHVIACHYQQIILRCNRALCTEQTLADFTIARPPN